MLRNRGQDSNRNGMGINNRSIQTCILPNFLVIDSIIVTCEDDDERK
jgi:hypothetical protein